MRTSGGCSYDMLSDEFGEWEQCMNHHESWPCSADHREQMLMATDKERARLQMFTGFDPASNASTTAWMNPQSGMVYLSPSAAGTIPVRLVSGQTFTTGGTVSITLT